MPLPQIFSVDLLLHRSAAKLTRFSQEEWEIQLLYHQKTFICERVHGARATYHKDYYFTCEVG